MDPELGDNSFLTGMPALLQAFCQEPCILSQLIESLQQTRDAGLLLLFHILFHDDSSQDIE